MSENWQNQRGDLNHDWLKNRFLIDLGSFMNILDDRIEDSVLERRFVRDALPQWSKRSSEAFRLVATFETEMSPKKLFEQPPLSRCAPATMGWLSNLVHSLWLVRCRVRSLREEAARALTAADRAYDRLRQALATCPDTQSALALRTHREAFAAFRSACEAASNTINRFPNRIEVV